MNNILGKPFTHEEELLAGTSKGILLAKLENIVLLDITYTSPTMLGGVYKQIFTFAPIESDSPRKGIIRLDIFDASTGTLTEGNEILIEILPPATDGFGDSGNSQNYGNITKEKRDKILQSLIAHGAGVRGDNPWNVDVHKHGIKLRGTWDESRSNLNITVTDKNLYVLYSQIWRTIDPLINNI